MFSLNNEQKSLCNETFLSQIFSEFESMRSKHDLPENLTQDSTAHPCLTVKLDLLLVSSKNAYLLWSPVKSKLNITHSKLKV